jgi:hypothetical protein
MKTFYEFIFSCARKKSNTMGPIAALRGSLWRCGKAPLAPGGKLLS